MNDKLTSVSNFIRDQRALHNLSQKEFGILCGMSQYTISCFEAQKNFPREDSLKKISNATGYSVHDIINYVEISNKHALPKAEIKVKENVTSNNDNKFNNSLMIFDKLCEDVFNEFGYNLSESIILDIQSARCKYILESFKRKSNE